MASVNDRRHGWPSARQLKRRFAFLKLFLALYLPIALAFALIAYGLLQIEAEKQMTAIRAQNSGRAEVAAKLLDHDIETVTSDLQVLARAPSVSRYLTTGSETDLTAVAELFFEFAREKAYYDQIRFIDATGRETVRVNRTPDGPVLVPDPELQDKGSRYYFRDTLRLAPGEVYVSPLDLNIEHQSVEVPHKPMLRLGTPVADAAGNKRGVVILNMFGDELLRHFREAMGEGRHAMLVNREGYWLSHPDSSKTWAFMFGREFTFQKAYPEAWERVVSADSGDFVTPQGLFTFATVHPLLPWQRSSSGSASPSGMSAREMEARDYFWKVITFVPADQLPTALLRHPAYLSGFALALLLLAASSGFLAATLLSRRHFRQTVFENEMRLREITATLGEGVYGLDREGRVTFMNPEAERLLGWKEAELLGRNGHDMFHYRTPEGKILEAKDCPVHRTIATGETYHAPHDWVIRKDGEVLPVSIVSTPILRRGEVVGSVAAFQDITSRLEAEQALKESEARFRNSLEYAPIGMALVSLDGRFSEVNRALCGIVGYDKQELEGLSFETITHPDDLEADRTIMRRLLAGDTDAFQTEKRYIRKGGRVVWVQLTGSILRGPTDEPLYFIVQIEDITSRKNSDEAIHHLAFYDTLTDLPNRRLFLDRLDRALSQARRHHRSMAIMFLDLDHFKEVNDTLGHGVGDVLLKGVATRLTDCLREGDTVSRQGGDEFVIILSEIAQPGNAARVAEKVLDALAAPFTIEGHTIHVGVSIGIAVYPVDGTDSAEELMKKADIAMYAVKEAGRNGYRFYGE